MRYAKRISAVIIVVCTSCVVETGGAGRHIDDLMTAPGGSVFFMHERVRKDGELLGFRKDTAFVLAQRAIYAVPGRKLNSRHTEVSTFPTGTLGHKLRPRFSGQITPELESQLLARIGQTASIR